MKITIDRNNFNDTLVYIGIFLYMSVSLIIPTFYAKFIPGFIYHLVTLISIFFLLLYNVLTIQKGDGIKIITALGVLGSLLLCIFLSGGIFQNYIYSLAVIFLLRDFDFNKLVKFVLPLMITLLLFVVVSSKIGIIQDYVEISSSRVRHYLGFRYSLFPSTVMLNIVGLSIFQKQEKITFKELIVLSAAVLWFFLQTNSRLTALSSVVFLLIGLVIKLFPKFLTNIRLLLCLLTPAYIYGAVLSYFIAGLFPVAGSWLRALNHFLGGRIYLASKSLYIYGFDWLGKPIQWVGNGLNQNGQRNTLSYLYVDNMYIQILQKYGLLFLLIFTLLMTVTMILLFKQGRYLLLLIFIVYAFHATIDDLTFNLHYNLFLVLMSLPFTTNSRESFIISYRNRE